MAYLNGQIRSIIQNWSRVMRELTDFGVYLKVESRFHLAVIFGHINRY